jgi:drug/metabolite transporter (DMT)-like permease
MSHPYLQLHLLVFILALTAILGKLIGLPAPVLVLWRTGLAALMLWLWQRTQNRSMLNVGTPNARADIFKALATGVVLGAHWMTFFGSIHLSTVSICLAGMASTSFFTALTEPLINRSRFSWKDLMLGILVVPGLLLIVGFNGHYGQGLICALVSAFLAALFPVMNRRLVLRGFPPATLTFYEMIGAFFLCACVSPLFIGSAADMIPGPTDLLWLLLLAGLCTAFAFSFHIRLLQNFTAFATSLAITFEPVYGILLAMLFFNEHKDLHPTFYLGVLTIVAANCLQVGLKRRSGFHPPQ